jgi:MYXO-CTERM domain-containing protein
MLGTDRVRVWALLIGFVALTSAASANAQEECPLGSVQKMEAGKTWCEPTVCETDINCTTGSVCRVVPLCVEVGVLDTKAANADGGTKLLVRQRCGENKSCPQNTTCSEKGRCMTLAQADHAGLATKSTSSAAPTGSAAPGGDAPKKSCGCSTPGTRGGESIGAFLALLGALTIGARRRKRPRAAKASHSSCD